MFLVMARVSNSLFGVAMMNGIRNVVFIILHQLSSHSCL